MASSLWPVVLAVFFGAAQLTVCVPVMTGAPVDVPSNRSDVLRAARFAVVEYNKEFSDEEYAYKATSIASSKIQVVAGLNFILEVNLGLTQCKKEQTFDVENCPLQTNGKKLHCHFVVMDVPWENITELTQRRCAANLQAKTALQFVRRRTGDSSGRIWQDLAGRPVSVTVLRRTSGLPHLSQVTESPPVLAAASPSSPGRCSPEDFGDAEVRWQAVEMG
ncbi:hypothetical protein ANANG_G00303950 [Anguilla anguilla]|uniref:Cystatin domain-containing protein n=1 Tax=Anguilla anguilla TaxID=7936 RepID=A0A9D3LM26_ANGAN|nr:hypothetical protein ANANG_G00303950 [Anguilla anguilla]